MCVGLVEMKHTKNPKPERLMEAIRGMEGGAMAAGSGAGARVGVGNEAACWCAKGHPEGFAGSLDALLFKGMGPSLP